MDKSRLKIAGKERILFIGVFLLVGILFLIFMENNKKDPILIGFSAQLTGKQAELGVQERNGVQLAIEEINDAGGIIGRKISLIIHDDLGIHKEAKLGDLELIKKGVVAVVGHATTAQTLAGLEATDSASTVMISPTVSTPELSGLDDYFFRVYPSFKSSSENFAKYVYKSNSISNIAIIYDRDNMEYSNTYSTTFANKFESLGGKITNELSFSSESQPDFSHLLSKLREPKVEGLLIVASDIDTALIAQKTRLMGWEVPMFTSAWAQTETLINNGGRAVEGMKIEQAYNFTSKTEAFLGFKSRYRARFGNDPSFGSAYSYEATLVLAEALKKTRGSKDGLKEALLKTQNFNGLMDNFSLDSFGDVERPWYLSTISDGKFIMVGRLTSSDSGGE